MNLKPACALLTATVMLCGLPAVADDPNAWLESDDDTTTVNEGDLVFLHETPDRRILQTLNYLTITPASMHTGWVALHQCQSNLDPVSAIEVMYRYHGLRNLQVLSTRGIESAWVEKNSVQMKQVEEGAEICIEAEVQVLKPEREGAYTLESGPFHRRFLDGYYPVRLDYRLRYPAGLLKLETVMPDATPGLAIDQQPGELIIDSLFEGKLTLKIRFIIL